MSFLYSTQKDNYIRNRNGRPFTDVPNQPPPGTVKKSTMYIIVALSVVMTSTMFASTVTVVYLIAKEGNISCDGGNNCSGSKSGHVIENAGSVTTFTRWGRNDCTSNAKVLYKGFTAGSRYNYHGGTSNVLCLPEEPQFNSSYPGMSGSYVYGSEYNARSTQLQAVFGKQLNEEDVPCAVCEVTGSSAMMMFPARTECYTGWSKQYSGYLMTSHEAHNKSMDIVCIDGDPGVIPGLGANNNGALFYFVEANGQLPYSKGVELSCVVCTK